MKKQFYFKFWKINISVLVTTFICFFTQIKSIAATYYSDPTSSAVTLTGQATGGVATSSGWSTSAAGPFGTVTIVQTDNIVIQQGSTVTTTTGGSQTVSNITFGTGTLGAVGSTLVGGTLVLAASSFNCQGNISGAGVYTNASANTTRITMNSSSKTINATLSGSGGFTISANIDLAGNTSIGGKISVTTLFTVNLKGFNLSCDILTMPSGSILKASGIEELAINTALPVASTTISTIAMDQSNPGVSNKLGKLTCNTGAISQYQTGLTLNTALMVGDLVMTTGKLILGNNDLTVTGTITVTTDGTKYAFISTNNPTATATGKLIVSVPAGVRTFIPCGTISATNGSSFDNIAVTPTDATTLTIQVKNVFANAVLLAANTTSREFNIASSNPSSTVLELTPAFPLTYNATASYVIGRYASGAWFEIPASRVNTATYTATVTSFGLFGTGTVGGYANNITPITISSFTAKAAQKVVNLDWATFNETNNALFNIQHSTNGVDFSKIGQLNGAGTSTSIHKYSFDHTSPSSGINYYRLMQQDADGKTTYSPVRSVLFGKKVFSIKNNVVNNVLDVLVSDNQEVVMSVFNLAGQKVITANIKGEQLIDVSKLTSGIYVAKLSDGQIAKFIKQ